MSRAQESRQDPGPEEVVAPNNCMTSRACSRPEPGGRAEAAGPIAIGKLLPSPACGAGGRAPAPGDPGAPLLTLEAGTMKRPASRSRPQRRPKTVSRSTRRWRPVLERLGQMEHADGLDVSQVSDGA